MARVREPPVRARIRVRDHWQDRGSRRKFRQPDTGRMIFVDEPRDGEMKPGMVRRLRDDLEQRGEL